MGFSLGGLLDKAKSFGSKVMDKASSFMGKADEYTGGGASQALSSISSRLMGG
ncbi:MAG: hypothetical protein LBJ83_02135 [Oscillospiraceae bacterium]|jgi:hypothetical protein|nr:hypothetical protein [Oscillospiraceae bacterium]